MPQEKFTCSCGSIFYRYPDRPTTCPDCLQVHLVVNGENKTAFPE